MKKTVHNRCIIKNIASLYNFSVGSYTEFMEENFKVSSKSVDSGRWNTQENYLWKSSTKANRGLSLSWPFHIILSRKVEPVNRGYAEQAFSNQSNKGTPLGGLDQNGKKNGARLG